MLILLFLLIILAVVYLIILLRRKQDSAKPLYERIDSFLPQTQCGQCGFQGCLPYADAIAKGRAQINQCPPGGDETIKAIALLLGLKPIPLNEAYGRHKTAAEAYIDESACIGCTLCIKACPVDAIVGAPKLMHTILSSECTGCELCLPPCPVDCIVMRPPRAHSTHEVRMENSHSITRQQKADRARERYQRKQQRQIKADTAKQARRTRNQPSRSESTGSPKQPIGQDLIQAAVARSRAKKERIRSQKDTSSKKE